MKPTTYAQLLLALHRAGLDYRPGKTCAMFLLYPGSALHDATVFDLGHNAPLHSIPAIYRCDPGTLCWVRPERPEPNAEVVRQLLDLGCKPQLAADLVGCHRTLAFREAKKRALQGVCPCCHRTLPPGQVTKTTPATVQGPSRPFSALS